ncbi:UvrD-helicase domain-containing protein [Spirochaeta cellobiosiphila]|uniref:UvrD-helicase domain-containing protein n=1 Tax=Spirochaeta cellobiosiphila TaxID=504483 RepID=UPI00040FF2A6|nr:UvrD-helicase domain-containing protein [Spirochaeta cellobiosiphila]
MKIPETLKRLRQVASADNGFFVLALHSFIEAQIREQLDLLPESRYEYGELLDLYRVLHNGKFPMDLLCSLTKNHQLSNTVRHQCRNVLDSESQNSLSLLIRFCDATGLSVEHIDDVKALEELITDWAKRIPETKYHNEMLILQKELKDLREKNFINTQRISEYQVAWKEKQDLERKLSSTLSELHQLQSRAKDRKEERKELRVEVFESHRRIKSLTEAINASQNKLEEYKSISDSLDIFKRMLHLSQSRRGFEDRILRLTEEQGRILRDINFKKDFMIKGSAGTGKSLVLLKSLETYLIQNESPDLGLQKKLPVVFLTYTRTLVNYNHYLAGLMNLDAHLDVEYTTADHLLTKVCKGILGINELFNTDELWRKSSITIDMSDKALVRELRSFLWAYGYSREDYIDKMIHRQGMKDSLNRKTREVIWQAKTEFEAYMDDHKCYSFSYLYYKTYLLWKEDPPKVVYDKVFLDEAQDLTMVKLFLLKTLSRGAMIMASDLDQSIYTPLSPFPRSGIQLQGNTRIIHTNFRNTFQIHELAERFRCGTSHDSDQHPTAFREGPRSILHRSDSSEMADQTLIERLRFYHDQLDFEWDNLAVISSANDKSRKGVTELMDINAIPYVRVDRDFDFNQNGVRIMTLFNAKGLSFPVCFIHLTDTLWWLKKEYSEERANKVKTNLLYVALTRAMDCLEVIVKNGEDHIVNELISCFDAESDS